MKYAVIVDSSCDLVIENKTENNIYMDRVPLRLRVGEREYVDDFNLDIKSFMEDMKSYHGTSGSAAPSPEEWYNAFKADEVFAVTISGELSGSYSSASVGKHMALEDEPEKKIHIFDSKSAGAGLTLIVRKIQELIAKEKSFEEIVEALPKIRERITGFYTINTLEYLQKGGRIGKVAGTIGELLNLKPIITTDDTGVYYTICKARGRKQALSKMTELLKEKLALGKCEVTVLECACKEEATKYMEQLAKLPNVENIKLNVLSPALGVHGGPGLLGLSVKLVE